MLKILFLSLLGLTTLLATPSTSFFVENKKSALPEIKQATTASTYYDGLDESKEGAAFRTDLAKLITSTHTKTTTYNGLSTVFKKTDYDPDKSGNVLWWYTGTSHSYNGNFGSTYNDTNREHVWPKHGGDAFPEKTGPGCDAHHLRPIEATLNSKRSSNGFDECAQITGNIVAEGGSTTYENLCYQYNSLFYPGVGYRGATARILMYMEVRWGDTYNLTFTDLPSQAGVSKKMGVISTLMKWHLEEPIQEFEVIRNDAVYEIQGNRNPFIDHPEYAAKIYCYDGKDYNNALQTVVQEHGGGYEKPTLESLTINPSSTTLAVGEEKTLSLTATPTNADKSVTWTSSDEQVATVSNGIVKALKQGTTTITATSTTNTSISTTCEITVKGVTGITVSGAPNKTTYYEDDLFDPDGLTITASYSDGSTNIISNNDCSFLDSVTEKKGLSLGTTSVKVTYAGYSQIISGITVIEKPSSISYDVRFKTENTDGSSTLTPTTIYEDYISEGSTYISGVTTATKVYAGTKGLKLGSSSTAGKISFTVNTTAIPTSSIVQIKGYKYSSDDGTVDVNGSTAVLESATEESTIEFEIENPTEITITPSKRIYLSGITIKTGGIEESVSVTGVDIGSDQTIDIGEQVKIVPTIYPDNASNKDYTLTNSDDSVVTLYQDGTVIGVKEGTSTITVSTDDGDYIDTCTITVNNPSPEVPVTSVTFAEDSISLYPGDTHSFSVSILPTDATNKNVTYSIGNSDVATVDSSGKVTAVAIGTTTLTVTSNSDNTKKDTATITVVAKPEDVHVNDIELSATRLEMYEGKTYALVVTFNPSNTSNKGLTYTSSDEGVATIDTNGTIHALLEGTTIITVTSKDNTNVYKNCEVIVKKINSQNAVDNTPLIIGLSIGIPTIIVAAVLTVLIHLKIRKKTLSKKK